MDLETFILSTPSRQPLFTRSAGANPGMIPVYQDSIGKPAEKSHGRTAGALEP
jgi:hypothetical protein